MKKLIKKILKEDQRERYLNKIIQVMKNDFPLIKNLKDYGFYDQLSDDEMDYVLSGIFGKPVSIHGNGIYNDGNEIYYEDSTGYWYKKEYDENGKLIYKEFSYGFWKKYEYDERGNVIYYEKSNGFWIKYEYDENDNMLYYENSRGEIRDNR